MVAHVHRLRPQGRQRIVAPIVVLTALGVTAIAYPQLLGNGQDTVQLAILGAPSIYSARLGEPADASKAAAGLDSAQDVLPPDGAPGGPAIDVAERSDRL